MLKDLPDVNDEIVPVEMGPLQRKKYTEVHDTPWSRNNTNSGIARFGKLRALCDWDPATRQSTKADKTIDIIDEAVAVGDKVVVFSYLLEPLYLLDEKLQKKYGKDMAGLLEGSRTVSERKELVEKFQNEESPQVLLASTGAGKEGITLTAANRLVFFNLWWNPSTNNQARDRIVRIGQRKVCYIYRLVTNDSVESRLMEILQSKGDMIEEIIGQLAVKRPRVSGVSDEAKAVLNTMLD